MKKSILSLLILGFATTGWSAEPFLAPPAAQPVYLEAPGYSPQPTPAQPLPPAPMVEGHVTPMPHTSGYPIVGTPASSFVLYENVKVKDPDHIHPCAVPQIFPAPDPCDPCGCVYVKVCAPECVPEISKDRHGKRTTYDYGDYRIQISARHGKVIVDYDD